MKPNAQNEPLRLTNPPPAHRVTLGKYKDSRFWAIWIDDELLAVTVYRKGARAMLAFMGLDGVAVELKRPRKTGRWR
jgi:hypothetical protein